MKAKTKTQPKRRKVAGSYPAYYLAIVLGLMILLEGFMLGVATPKSVSEGLSVLDVSQGVSEVIRDFNSAVEPMIDQVYSVNKFYQLAAAEMTSMLDMSEADILVFPRGVVEFYDLASIEMAELLDFSDHYENMPQVAGMAIFR